MSTFKISEFKYLVVNCGYTDRLLEHVPKIQEFLAEFDDGYYEGEDATSAKIPFWEERDRVSWGRIQEHTLSTGLSDVEAPIRQRNDLETESRILNSIFDSVPDETLGEIFSRLDPMSRLLVGLTSRRWRKVVLTLVVPLKTLRQFEEG